MTAAIIIVVIIVIAGVGVGVYYSTLPTPSASTTMATTSAAGVGPANSTELTVLAIGGPSSIEPAGAFSSEDTLVMANVYQQLLTYNYTDPTTLLPMLATSWASNPSMTSYTFNLRSGVNFRNSDPFNAAVVWFNFNRVLVMNQIGTSFFSSILYNATTAFSTGYVIPQGLDNALAAGGYTLSSTNGTLRQAQSANDLASILSHFDPSNSTIQKIMSFPNQAIVVLNDTTVQFNLINPYSSFAFAVASTGGGQIDPAFVDANGGVQPNAPNSYVNFHDMSTGPYYIKNYVQAEYLTLQENPDYWVSKLPSGQQNVMLTLPHIPVVIIQYASQSSQVVQGIQNNLGALIAGPPIPALAPTYLPSLENQPGIQVVSLPNAPTYSFPVTAMNTQKYPTNITNFRLALVHAINYSEILSSVAEGYAQEMVGPISPGLPYYNPANLPPYSFDDALSIQLLTQAGFKVNLPNGTVVNSSGKTIPPINIIYWNADPIEVKATQEMQTMFAQIGVTLTLDGETSSAGLAAVSNPPTSSGYPNLYIWFWYPSYFDPVYQDLVVQTNSAFSGVFGNPAAFSGVDNLTTNLPFETNKAAVLQTVTQVYNIVYQQAPYIWLYATTPYWVQRTYLAGVFYNPALEGFYFPTMYYTTTG
jgi:peptide/nickel transport system substrate-binding protein